MQDWFSDLSGPSPAPLPKSRVPCVPCVPTPINGSNINGLARNTLRNTPKIVRVPCVPHTQNGPPGIQDLIEAGERAGAISADDFEERAAIFEFDGGHGRKEAERLARVECGMVEGGNDA